MATVIYHEMDLGDRSQFLSDADWSALERDGWTIQHTPQGRQACLPDTKLGEAMTRWNKVLYPRHRATDFCCKDCNEFLHHFYEE